jgi:hypothetical protein
MAPKTGKPLWKTENGMAGFQGLAAILSERYAIDPPLDRRRIRDWWHRGTRNAAGEPFPQPADTTHKVDDSKRAYRWFDIEQVDAWLRRGIPGPCGSGWKFPAAEESAKL